MSAARPRFALDNAVGFVRDPKRRLGNAGGTQPDDPKAGVHARRLVGWVGAVFIAADRLDGR